MKLQWNHNLLRLLLCGMVAVLVLSGCFRPKGVLSQSTMTDVLVDMHKTDAILAENNTAYGQYSKKAPYYNYIFKKHGITKAEFDSTLVWYTKNPQKFENMYDDVIKRLTALQKDVAAEDLEIPVLEEGVKVMPISSVSGHGLKELKDA